MWTISPWWDNGNRPELGNNAPSVRPGRSPIKYPEIWRREREENLPIIHGSCRTP